MLSPDLEIQTPNRASAGATSERLLYISTLDRIISVMFPHLDAARAAGWRVEVACQPTVYWEDLLRHADAVHAVPLQRFPLHPKNILALWQLVRLIRAGAFTIVHCHNPTGGFIGRLAATLVRLFGVRPLRVYTAHGFHFHRYGGKVSNGIYRLAETVAGRFWSDAVLVITGEDYEAARRYNVVPAERLFLTGGVGVSAQDTFNPALVTADEVLAFRREIHAEAPGTPVITMVGELIPRKRPLDAVEAFVHIRQRFPEAHLVLVGDGSLYPVLLARVQSLGLSQYVHLLGFRRDVRTILAATDVFLFPSGQEGLPCAIQEALAMEVPVVATDVRGNADLVNESCGRRVPMGDWKALATRVCELLDLPPETRRHMGQAGRQRMLECYDRAACVAQWQRIYTTLRGRSLRQKNEKPTTKNVVL